MFPLQLLLSPALSSHIFQSPDLLYTLGASIGTNGNATGCLTVPSSSAAAAAAAGLLPSLSVSQIATIVPVVMTSLLQSAPKATPEVTSSGQHLDVQSRQLLSP